MNATNVWKTSFSLGLYDLLMPLNFDRSIRHTFEALAPARGAHILEVGIGSGRSLEHAADWLRAGGRLTAVDILGSGLKAAEVRARRLGVESQVTFVQGDVRRLSDIVDAGFAGAYSHFVLYALAEAEDRRHALVELAKVLAPGARVAITVPNQEYTANALIDEARSMEWARSDTTVISKWVRSRIFFGIGEKETKRVVEDAMIRGELHRYSKQGLYDELAESGFEIEAIDQIHGVNSYRVRATRCAG